MEHIELEKFTNTAARKNMLRKSEAKQAPHNSVNADAAFASLYLVIVFSAAPTSDIEARRPPVDSIDIFQAATAAQPVAAADARGRCAQN